MKISQYFLPLCFLLATISADAQERVETIVMDGRLLSAKRKAHLEKTETRLEFRLRSLIKNADDIVRRGETYSVIKKTVTPPSGSKNDYMSLGPYWWPDPSKPGGLPYIRRDGERNPEILKIPDDAEYNRMLDDAEALALAFYFSRDEKYAKHASTVLRTWFLDPGTRMNPNLNFAQGIPGRSTGRGIGMIETRAMYRAIDAAILLRMSSSWSAEDHRELKAWFREFLRWSLESPLGKDEADEKNNHGTYYDVQVVAYAIFTDEPNIARRQVEVTKKRIASQIQPDGSQPHELERTLSWGYVNMNAYGFATLARLAEAVDVDLWGYQTTDGRSIRRAIEWIVPFASGEKEWTYKQIKPRGYDLTIPLLEIAARKYKKPEYSAVATKLKNAGEKNGFRSLGMY